MTPGETLVLGWVLLALAVLALVVVTARRAGGHEDPPGSRPDD